jgi:hypothetical protein
MSETVSNNSPEMGDQEASSAVISSSQVADVTRSAFTDTPEPPKRRGRHPAACRCIKCEARRAEQFEPGGSQQLAAPQDNGGFVEQTAPKVDKVLIEKTVRSLCKVTDSMVCRTIKRLALRVSEDDEGFARSMVEGVAMHQDEQDMLAETSAALAEKYSIVGQYAPEVILIVAITAYASRTYTTIQELKSLAKKLAPKTEQSRSI